MMSGYDCLNKKRFNSRRKVDSELAATTSVGSVLQMCGAASAKARLPTVDSLMVGSSTAIDNVPIKYHIDQSHKTFHTTTYLIFKLVHPDFHRQQYFPSIPAEFPPK